MKAVIYKEEHKRENTAGQSRRESRTEENI
jgi:hypothetical protein